MIDITVKFLGGLRDDMGMSATTLAMPDGATVADVAPRLRALGIDLNTEMNIVVLNDRGLGQWPLDRPLDASDVVVVFPHISGGNGPLP